jgi:hypothetical protein
VNGPFRRCRTPPAVVGQSLSGVFLFVFTSSQPYRWADGRSIADGRSHRWVVEFFSYAAGFVAIGAAPSAPLEPLSSCSRLS